MSGRATRRAFAETIGATLALLETQRGPAGAGSTTLPVPHATAGVPALPLPGLLAQCRQLIAEAATPPPPLRCLHHLACTGGTLFARCIAALPNTRVLSEVDPLSAHGHAGARFFPTDLIGLARFGARPPDRAVLLEIFRAGLDVLYADSRRHGLDLVLRDHAHSQFCYGPAAAAAPPRTSAATVAARPTLREILAAPPEAGETGVGNWPLRGVVTVRDPLDSYLSMQAHGWLHFTPATPEEYARRYHAFLDRHADLPWLRYEDLLADPEAVMARLCDALDLARDPDFRHRLAAVRLSGDSGRSGAAIRPRPRRPCPPDLAGAAAASESFARLRARLGYPA